MRRCSHAGVVVVVVTIAALVVAAATFGGANVAHARDLEFSLAGGASQLHLDEGGDDDVLNDQWGPWIRPSLAVAPIDDAPQLRLGGGVGFSWHRGTIDDAFLAGDADLFLLTPEFQASWRQPLGAGGGDARWDIEPGVGVGPAIGALWVIGTDWGYGYSVRPFLRAGYEFDNWSAGLEAAYRFGHLNFDDGDGDIENLEVGVFVAWKI